MDFGSILLKLRVERGVYQRELAEYLSVSVGTISNYENGVHCPDLRSLCRIAEFFHVSADYLLGLTSNAMPIDNLNVKLSDECTVGQVMNTVLELSESSRQSMVKYMDMIKTCDEASEKEETIIRQRATIQRQKQIIGRLKQNADKQTREILRLKALAGEEIEENAEGGEEGNVPLK